MTSRYELPTLDDLVRLAEPHDVAITVYAPTSPAANDRDVAITAVKSAVDTSIRALREHGLRHAVEKALRAQWDAIAADGELWGNLAASLAVFISPDSHHVYALPNQLESQQQVSTYFDLGQLVRSVATDQHAYALQLSANAWQLWEATATTRATELTPTGSYPTDAADATHRDEIRGRQHEGRLVGDEGKKTLLDTYATRVAEAVGAELGDRNPTSPLFVFASETLQAMFNSAYGSRRQVVAIHGAADDLRPHQIDEAMRQRLPQLSAQRVDAQLERMGNDVPRGLVRTDVAEIARATAMGAVDALVYEFTVDILGTYDDVTGEVTLASDEPGYDLLSRIAIGVHQRGGDVIPVRDSEVSGGVWNGTAVAHLRYPI